MLRYVYFMTMTVLGLYLIVLLKRLAYLVFPHDPPPIQDGETIASRLGKLHWD